ncbi:MAG: hypothetical protein V1860_00680 [bacterium]
MINDKKIFFFVIAVSIITGLAYFIIKIRNIPQKKIIPQNLHYMPRTGLKDN